MPAFPPPPLWNVALYIRLSREDGGDESLSVSNQRKILLEFLDLSFPEAHVLSGVYIDDGATGTDQQRPGFQRLLEDIRSGRVNCVICKNLSRAFRNYADQGYFLEHYFPLRGVRFISLSAPRLDSFLDPEAIQGYEVPITGIMNDRYACRTSLDVRRTFDTKRRRGEFIGAFAPYGYRKDPLDRNHLIPDGEAAAVVRDIFFWYVREGLSKAGIARRLSDLAVPTPSAYKQRCGLAYQNPSLARSAGLWSAKTVGAILSNPVYRGDLVQGRQRVVSYKVHRRIAPPPEEWFVAEGKHAPLVDHDTFQAAQELSRRPVRSPPGGGPPHLLSGLLFCAGCGRPMARRSAKGHVYYACRAHGLPARRPCAGGSVRADLVEEALMTALRVQFALCLRPPALQNAAPRPGAELRLRRQLGQLRLAADHLYPDWKSGVLKREEYLRLKDSLSGRIKRLEQELERLSAPARERASPAPQPPCSAGFPDRLDRGLLTALVGRILIHADGAVELCFLFRAPLPAQGCASGHGAVGPVGPTAPVAPAGPVGPVAPAAPAGPVGPVRPSGPGMP